MYVCISTCLCLRLVRLFDVRSLVSLIVPRPTELLQLHGRGKLWAYTDEKGSRIAAPPVRPLALSAPRPPHPPTAFPTSKTGVNDGCSSTVTCTQQRDLNETSSLRRPVYRLASMDTVNILKLCSVHAMPRLRRFRDAASLLSQNSRVCRRKGGLQVEHFILPSSLATISHDRHSARRQNEHMVSGFAAERASSKSSPCTRRWASRQGSAAGCADQGYFSSSK